MGRVRKTHVLRKVRDNRRPSNIVFFDTEAHLGKDEWGREAHTLRLWVAEHWRLRNNGKPPLIRKAHGFDPDSLADFIDQATNGGSTTYVFAHNIPYDLAMSNVFVNLLERGWYPTQIYEENATFYSILVRGRKKIILLDTLNFFPGRLEEIGRMLGLEKGRVDFESADDEALLAYCSRDVEIIREAVLRHLEWIEREGYGGWRPTRASLAFSIFRRTFMKHIIVIHNNREALRLERLAYGGGLVRCWRAGAFGGETFYKLDVNSMYPAEMRDNDYPTELVCVLEDVDVERLEQIVDRYLVIADLVVKPEKPFFRRKAGNRVIYPLYEFRGVFSTPEVVELLRDGSIRKVLKVAVYRGGKIFREFVEHFYEKRLEAKRKNDRVGDMNYKLILNSLYGKFGSRASVLVPYPVPDEVTPDCVEIVDPETGKRQRIAWIAGIPFIRDGDAEGFNSFPAIAAHVTAYARMYLMRLTLKAGLENVYYSDTDSLIVNSVGRDRLSDLIHPEKLGYLKEEGVADRLIIYARKDYQFGEQIKRKGIPKGSQEILPGVFVRSEWPSLKKHLHSFDASAYVIERRIVRLSRLIYDGIIEDDGFVRPFTRPPSFDPDPLSLPDSS